MAFNNYLVVFFIFIFLEKTSINAMELGQSKSLEKPQQSEINCLELYKNIKKLPSEIGNLVAFEYFKPSFLPRTQTWFRINEEEEYTDEEIEKAIRWQKGTLGLKVFDSQSNQWLRTGATSNKVKKTPLYVVGPNESGHAALKNKKLITVNKGEIKDLYKLKNLSVPDSTSLKKYCFDNLLCVHSTQAEFAGDDHCNGVVLCTYRGEKTIKRTIPDFYSKLILAHEYLKLAFGPDTSLFKLEDTFSDPEKKSDLQRNLVLLDHNLGRILDDFQGLSKIKHRIADFFYSHLFPKFVLIKVQGNHNSYYALYNLDTKKYNIITMQDLNWKQPFFNLQKQLIENEKNDIKFPENTLECFNEKRISRRTK